MYQPMRVLEIARAIADDINTLAVRGPAVLRNDWQIQRSCRSIAANIREGLGRRRGPDRNQFFRIARGSAEETDEHLHAHFRQQRIPATTYWRIHHRIMLCAKMLTVMLK